MGPRKHNRRRTGVWPAVVAIFLAIHTRVSAENQPVRVVTTIFPLREWIEAVGGDCVQVRQLLPAGVEPHTYAPRPSDVLAIRQADVFVFLHPVMEPWAQDLLAGAIRPGLRILEAAEHVPLHRDPDEDAHRPGTREPHEMDPHVWLDPVRATFIVREIAAVLGDVDPAHKMDYAKRGEEYVSRLNALNARISEMLASCDRRVVIFVGHSAFGYFAERYNLTFITPYPAYSPNAAPGPRALAEIARVVRETGSPVIFHEELIVPREARALARETGARLEVLHAAHNLTPEEMRRGLTYLSIMEDNARRLKKALGCH